MSEPGELLTPSEAAVVAGVSVRDVNRAIDEHILPKSLYILAGGRRLRSSACAYVSFYFHSAKALTADQRSVVIRALTSPGRSAKTHRWTVEQGFLTVNLDRFVADASARHAELVRAREMVIEDPEILGGVPVVRGTRIPVYDVAAALDAGQSAARLKAAYGELDDDRIALAKLYVDANPPRGRRRALKMIAPDLKPVSERTVTRRPRG